MKVFPFHDEPSEDSDRREEANDPVWRLLGESPRPEPGPWVVARTLARRREVGAASWRGVLRWAVGGGMGLCLAMVLLARQVELTPIRPAPVAVVAPDA